MNDRKYKLMVSRLVDELVPGDDKQKRAVHLHLITTSEYFAAHGQYVFECELAQEHVRSEEIIREKIGKLIK